MGLTGKLISEIEIKSPADKYFNGWIGHGDLLSKVHPDFHSSEVHEGDGKSLDSISSYNFVLDGNKVVSAKGKMEAIDEENKSLTFNVFGGYVGERYRSYKENVQVFSKDGKNILRCTIEYEKLNEEVPEPINLLEVVVKFAKGLDTILLQA